MCFFGVFVVLGVLTFCGVFFFGKQATTVGLVRMDALCHMDILSKEFQAFFFGSPKKLLSLGDGWAGKKWEEVKTRQKKTRV